MSRPDTSRPWTAEEEATVRRMVADGATDDAIAAAVGRTAGAVGYRRHKLRLVNLPRPWTKAECHRLVELMEQHHTYAEAAAILGRGVSAVRERCWKLDAAMTTANGRTVSEIARRLGVDHKTVAWWIRRGYLKGHRLTAPMGRGQLLIVEHEDLTTFLEDERHWHLWTPERITESGLREWATELRGHVRFLTTQEVADRLCVTHYQVCKLISQGRIPAVKRGNNWLIRADRLVRPVERPKLRGPDVTDRERATIRRLWGTVPAAAIARRLKRPGTTVHRIAHAMGLPGYGRGYWKRKERAA